VKIRFDFGTLTLDAELLDTPTAKAVAAALPLKASVLTWAGGLFRGGGQGRFALLAMMGRATPA
jgi:Cyclophilin-like